MTWPKKIGRAFVDGNGNLVGTDGKDADAYVVLDSIGNHGEPTRARPVRPKTDRTKAKAKAARRARKRQRRV